MKVEILCFGTELVAGEIPNTNAQIISMKMENIGIEVLYHNVVGDHKERMEEAMDISLKRSDVVICTGGLGPTMDDMSKEIVSGYFDLPLKYDNNSYLHIKSLFDSINIKITDNNMRQTYFPEGSLILKNYYGTANGCIVEKNGKTIILLPGPPLEMEKMLDAYIIPYMVKKTEETIYSHKIVIKGLGESMVEDRLIDLILDSNIAEIATYAGNNQVMIRVTSRDMEIERARKKVMEAAKIIEKRLADYIKVEDNYNHGKILSFLIEKKISLSTAESCTGGLIAAEIVRHPGISKIFQEGYITYSNESKISVLGVSEDNIEIHGAVSSEVAEEMSKKVSEKSKSQIGIAVTGIAGPGGGSELKPVGLVYICIYYMNTFHTEKHNFSGDRNAIREKIVNQVFIMLSKVINS